MLSMQYLQSIQKAAQEISICFVVKKQSLKLTSWNWIGIIRKLII
jgi:hypothetical protein